MRVVSCFAGIGGFDLGFECAGFEVVAVVEKDAKCRKLLAAKFPLAAQFDDVSTAGKHNLPQCDMVCGGFPCQGLSVSGLRAGLADARSGLFYELTRITHELQPAFLVWENVPGLLSSDSGRDFARVLIELDRIGYHGAWRTFNAQHFGVAQRRRRVFGVFARGDIGADRCGEILSLAEGMRWHPAPGCGKGEDVTGTLNARTKGGGGLGTDFDCNGGLQVAHTLSAEGADASEDGTGRGTPLICDVAGSLCNNGRAAGSATQQDAANGMLIPEFAHALTSRNERNEPSTETLIVSADDEDLFSFAATDYKAGKFESTDRARALTTSADRSRAAPVIAVSIRGRHANGGGPPAVTTSHHRVRRMTPTECERIQGFPDGHTLGFADGPRYKMLGNAVVVNVAAWLGKRIMATTQPASPRASRDA